MRGIDPNTWQLVSPPLDHALERDAAGRETFVAGVRAEQPAVAALLEQLLAHEAVLHSDFLEWPSAVSSTLAGLTGTTIGAYTLERPLVMGGMVPCGSPAAAMAVSKDWQP